MVGWPSERLGIAVVEHRHFEKSGLDIKDDIVNVAFIAHTGSVAVYT